MCPSGCTCQDSVVRCSNRGLTNFPSQIPPETTELFLDSNDISQIPKNELLKLKKLRKLSVFRNIIMQPFSCRDLSNNRLVTVESETFSTLEGLSTLILSYNKLQCIESNAFIGLNSLRILSLHGNDISRLPESAFRSLHNISHM
jgi:slit protein 2